MTSASPTPGDLDALYDETGDVIAQPLPDELLEPLRAFRTSYRSHRLAEQKGGPAAMSALAEALVAFPAARQAIAEIRTRASAAEPAPDTAPVGDGAPNDEITAPEAEAPASSMPIHPAAAIFPMLPTADLQKLADNIKEFGLREPIVVFEGRIIDGRNRKAACVLAGIEPTYREWDGEGSLVAWILSVNLHRRHLTDTQRAMIGARAREAFTAEAEERRNAKLAQNKGSTVSADLRYRELSRGEEGKSAEVAAAQLQVSTRAVEQASTVIAKGAETLVEAVTNGAVSLDAAAAVAALPADEQRKLVEQGAVRAKAAEMRKAKKQARDAAKKDAKAKPAGGSEPDAPVEESGADAPAPPPTKDASADGPVSRADADARVRAIEKELRIIVRAGHAVSDLVPDRSIVSTLRILEAFLSAVMDRPFADDPDAQREDVESTARALIAEPKGALPGETD